MSMRASTIPPMEDIQSNLLAFPGGELNLNLSTEKNSNSPPPANPFSPQCQTPQTPQMIRQSSTSFTKFKQSLIANNHTINMESVSIPIELNKSVSKQSDSILHTKTETKAVRTDKHSIDIINTQKADRHILLQNGYEMKGKICDTPQGSIYKAIIMSATNQTQVAIKKTQKKLYSKRISLQNNMSIVTNENIIKEAIILHHLTVDNTATADYIAKFINFFETEHTFYLVMEYCGDLTLKQFVEKSFQYINEGKLSMKKYKRIIKYVFWQIAVTLHWMNNDMHCCHLDLNLDNVIVKNGTFMEGSDGKITINQNLFIKVIDFGLSEVFKVKKRKSKLNLLKEEKDETEQEYVYKYEYDPYEIDWENNDGNPFFCRKFGIKKNQYCAPQIWVEEPYDAMKADAWDMGIILFKLITGEYPYINADSKTDSGYYCIENNILKHYLEINELSKFVSGSVLSLLNGLLHMDESERFLIKDIITHPWFKSYYAKYKHRIEEKSMAQKQKRKQQKKKMKAFPYYNINSNITHPLHPVQQ